MDTLTAIFYWAVCGLIVGLIAGSTHEKGEPLNPVQTFFEVIKWISIIIIALYILLIVAALTDGIGDIPLVGGAVWVSGHWTRGHWRRK